MNSEPRCSRDVVAAGSGSFVGVGVMRLPVSAADSEFHGFSAAVVHVSVLLVLLLVDAAVCSTADAAENDGPVVGVQHAVDR